MEREIVKRLNYCYYAMMLLAVLAATAIYFLLVKGMIAPVDRNSTWGMVIQYFVILDALVTIPTGLYLFRRRSLKIAKIEDETMQADAYVKAATSRIVTVSNTMVFGIAAYYLLGGYQSMLWVAAISAIGWYFTKPTEQKVRLELHASENDQY